MSILVRFTQKQDPDEHMLCIQLIGGNYYHSPVRASDPPQQHLVGGRTVIGDPTRGSELAVWYDTFPVIPADDSGEIVQIPSRNIGDVRSFLWLADDGCEDLSDWSGVS